MVHQEKLLCLLSLIPLMVSCAEKESTLLDEASAISAAEEFIVMNGYTDLPPTEDKSNLSFESLEWSRDPEEILKRRRNTLEKQAYGVSRYRDGGYSGWSVVFRYRVDNGRIGRAVTMNADFNNIRVQHQDTILDKVEKKLK